MAQARSMLANPENGRVTVISASECLPQSVALRSSLERACLAFPEGAPTIAHMSLNACTKASIRADVVVLVAEATPLAALDLVLAAIDPAVSAEVVLISDANANVRSRRDALVMKQDDATTALPGILRGILRATHARRGMETELALVTRVLGTVREELDAREEEIQMAAMVQRDFLPLHRDLERGFQIATLFRPLCGVSGDVFNIKTLDESTVSIFIADAVGHGVPAALLGMAVARSVELVEREGAQQRILGPAETLDRLNQNLVQHQRTTTRFATAVAALLDVSTRTLRLASAGHPPCFLMRAGEMPRTLEMPGGLLGVFPDEEDIEASVVLEEGDAVVFYSDGVEQALYTPDGPGHPQAFAAASGASSADEVIERLAAQLDAHAGSLHPEDDVTLLVLYAGSKKQVDRRARARDNYSPNRRVA